MAAELSLGVDLGGTKIYAIVTDSTHKMLADAKTVTVQIDGGDVYFDIKKAKDYGKLSHQAKDKMESGARVAPGEKKNDPLDFALWIKAGARPLPWPNSARPAATS